MDYDADGTLDFVSGSYDPGDVYLFRGLGAGKYAHRERLEDEHGLPLVHHPAELAEYGRLKRSDPAMSDRKTLMAMVASFGSWPAPVDWDGDGDLDMLIGSFGGALFLRTNVGTRAEPKYAGESEPVEADGEPLRVNAHANPVVADWDGDGLWDLVVSAGDGSVGWYRNEGTARAPRLGARRPLVAAKSKNKFLTQYLAPGEEPAPGARAQICVTDYDGDGALDLLLGDYSDVVRLRALDATERAELDALLREQAELEERLWSDALDEAAQEAASKRLEALSEEVAAYHDPAREPRTCSFVWLYRRVPGVEGAGVVSPAERTVTAAAASQSGPVLVDAFLERDAEQTLYTLRVELEMRDGWHVYASVPKGGHEPETSIGLRLPEGVETAGAWERPAGIASRDDPRTRVYEGVVTFTRALRVAAGATGAIGVDVHYMACDADGCLPPTTASVSLALPAEDGGESDAADEALGALVAEHEASELGYVESYAAFRPRFEAFAQAQRGTEAEVTALLWLLNQSWWLHEEGKMETTAQAIADDLLARHADSPQLGRIAETDYVLARSARAPAFERLLESPHARVRAAAHLGLAKLDPPAPGWRASGASAEEAHPHLAALVAEYADVPHRATTYGAIARAYLDVHTNAELAVGALAPEMEGADENGAPMKLSDFRGRVVLLDFWGDW